MRISNELGGYSPTLRLFSSAFWVAWITILYSGDCICVSTSTAYSVIDVTYMLSTACLGVIWVIAACLPGPANRLLHDRRFMYGAMGICVVATCGIAFAGSIPEPLFYICACLSGAATAMLALKAQSVYIQIEFRKSMVTSFLALILGVLLYAMSCLIGECYGSVAVLVYLCAMPVIGMYLAFLPSDTVEPLEDKASYVLTSGFWKTIVFIAVLVFAFSTIRGYYPQFLDSEAFSSSRCDVGLGLILMCLVCIVLVLNSDDEGKISTLLYWMFLGTVIMVLPVLIIGLNQTLADDLISVANGLIMMTAWNLLCQISYRSGMSYVRVFGFGYGIMVIFMTLGYMTGSFFGSILVGWLKDVAGIPFCLLCLAAAILLLRKEDLVKLMEPSPRLIEALIEGDGSHGSEDGQAEPERPQASENGVPSEEAHMAKGRFKMRCEQVAEEYGLSARETEVFMLMVKSKEAKAIADELFISFNTVRTHIRKIYGKLGVHNKREMFDLIDAKDAARNS